MKPFHTTLREKPFVITAEIPLTGANKRTLVEHTQTLALVADGIQLGDGRENQVQISPLAGAAIVLEAGADPIMHLTCRDRNRMALQSDLLGAAALGVRTLILSRGEKLDKIKQHKRKGVFELNGAELVGLAEHLSESTDIVEPPGFLLGSFATVFEPSSDWAPRRMLEKAKLGLRFVQTQPCLNLTMLRRYMAHLVHSRLPYKLDVLVEVPLITSFSDLQQVQSNQPGSPLPEDLVKPVLSARDPTQAGIELCSSILRAVADVPGVSGANVRYFGDADQAARAITEAQLS